MIMHSEKYYRDLNKKLLDEAQTAGLSIIEDKINRRGGVCRLDEKIIVIYDLNTVWQERNRLIVEALELAGGTLTDKNIADMVSEE
jgi:hypothetical protein